MFVLSVQNNSTVEFFSNSEALNRYYVGIQSKNVKDLVKINHSYIMNFPDNQQ